MHFLLGTIDNNPVCKLTSSDYCQYIISSDKSCIREEKVNETGIHEYIDTAFPVQTTD